MLNFRKRAHKLAYLFILFGVMFQSAPAGAIPLLEELTKAAEVRIESWFGLLTQAEEDVAFINIQNERRAEIGLPPLPLPQARIQGQGFIDLQTVLLAHIGDAQTLTYGLVDASTGNSIPIPSQLAIAAVLYEFSIDLLPTPQFQFLGISSDASNSFALNWTAPGFEPFIRATPLDAFGNPIVIINSETNDNALVGLAFEVMASPAVPEPTTWAMMLLGFAGIGFMAYRRKSKPALMAA
jgi:hypothetical protein